MASRNSSAVKWRAAQVIITCQICRKASPVWKCINCVLFMCGKCKISVHSKEDTAKTHKIVNFKDIDISAEELKQPTIDLQRIPCTRHSERMCCVYCVLCKEFICPKCLTGEHKGNVVNDIETVYNEKLKYLQENVSAQVDPYAVLAIFRSFTELFFPESGGSRNIKFKVKKTFKTNYPFIHRLCVSQHNTAWLACYKSKYLEEVRCGSDLETVRRYDDTVIYDMTLTSSGELLLIFPGDSNLYRLSDGGMNRVHDFSPLIPKAVGVSENNIIVSVMENGPVRPLKSNSRRQCSFLDKFGKDIVKVVENDKENKRLFIYLSSLTGHNKYDLVAVEELSAEFRRIVAIRDNAIQWVYEGNPGINTIQSPFSPHDIVVTSLGSIIVPDINNHALHVLSDDGDLLECIMTNEFSIIFPYSLNIDSVGRLWIGCHKLSGHSDGAKLHIVEFKGY